MNWEDIKNKYLKDPKINLLELANKFGVNYTTLRSKKSREHWDKMADNGTTILKNGTENATIETVSKVATTKKKVKIKAPVQQLSNNGTTILQQSQQLGNKGTTILQQSQHLNIEQLENIGSQAKHDTEATAPVELTGKQIIFCYEFITDFNATRSAICAGYSKNTARSIGAENLTKPYIMCEIRRLQSETLKQLEINPSKIIMEHMKIAFADITTYMDIGREEQTLFNEDGTKYEMMVDYAHLKEGNLIDGSVISEIQVSKDATRIKMQDKYKSLDFLAKYAQLGQDYHKQMIEMEKLTIMKERFKLELERNVNDNDNGNLDQLIKAIHQSGGGGEDD
jgi:phage terminase small subunit